jgi:hypothetical protein
MDNEILTHLIDIKERIAVVEEKQDQVISMGSRVSELEKEMKEVKTTFRLFQWGIGIMVALIASIVKTWKN